MLGIFVTMQIKPGFTDQFREASIDDSEGSVRDEPGCFRFDTLRATPTPTASTCTWSMLTRQPWRRTGTLRITRSGALQWTTGLRSP